MEDELTLALEADARVDKFLKEAGFDPAAVRMEPGYEKLLPESVMADLEYSRAFWAKQEGEGITL